jgi:hypothetical protein
MPAQEINLNVSIVLRELAEGSLAGQCSIRLLSPGTGKKQSDNGSNNEQTDPRSSGGEALRHYFKAA